MSDKRKRAIRARQAATGERYTTAQRNLLGGPGDRPPTCRIRNLIDKIILIAEAEARVDETLHVRGMPESALLKHLLSLDDGDLRKVEILMFAGREGENILELDAEVDRDSHDRTAHHIAEKLPALADYLRAGLKAAEEQNVDLDGGWAVANQEDVEADDEYPEVPHAERSDCDWCGRSVPDGELQAVGAGVQEAPMICARCWRKMDDEARAENALRSPPPLTPFWGNVIMRGQRRDRRAAILSEVADASARLARLTAGMTVEQFVGVANAVYNKCDPPDLEAAAPGDEGRQARLAWSYLDDAKANPRLGGKWAKSVDALRPAAAGGIAALHGLGLDDFVAAALRVESQVYRRV